MQAYKILFGISIIFLITGLWPIGLLLIAIGLVIKKAFNQAKIEKEIYKTAADIEHNLNNGLPKKPCVEDYPSFADEK